MISAEFHTISEGPRERMAFSHAVEADGWVVVAGQVPTDLDPPGTPMPEGVEAQTRAVFESLDRILAEIGLDRSHIVQCRCYLTQFERDFEAFNRTYLEHFPADRLPARTTVGVTALVFGALVEIDCLAKRP